MIKKHLKFQTMLFIFIPLLAHAWIGDVQISTSTVVSEPSVSYSSFGNAVVVWVDGLYPNQTIMSSTYNVGVWSVPVAVSTTAPVSNPKVATDALGNAVAVWEELSGGVQKIMAAYLPVGFAWTVPTTLSTSTVNFFPALSMNAAGFIFAAWINNIADALEVSYANFNGPWSAPITVSLLPGSKYYPQIGVDGVGNGILLWEEGQNGDIYAANSVGTVWGAPILIDLNGRNSFPSLSVDSSGNALASWIGLHNQEVRVVQYISGAWIRTPTVISSAFADGSVIASYLTDGFAVWSNLLTGSVQASNLNGGYWSYPPYDLSLSAENSEINVSVGSAGTATMTWVDLTDGSINAAFFPDGGSPTVPQQISSSGYNYSPAVSVGGINSVVVWVSESSGVLNIHGNVN